VPQSRTSRQTTFDVLRCAGPQSVPWPPPPGPCPNHRSQEPTIQQPKANALSQAASSSSALHEAVIPFRYSAARFAPASPCTPAESAEEGTRSYSPPLSCVLASTKPSPPLFPFPPREKVTRLTDGGRTLTQDRFARFYLILLHLAGRGIP